MFVFRRFTLNEELNNKLFGLPTVIMNDNLLSIHTIMHELEISGMFLDEDTTFSEAPHCIDELEKYSQ